MLRSIRLQKQYLNLYEVKFALEKGIFVLSYVKYGLFYNNFDSPYEQVDYSYGKYGRSHTYGMKGVDQDSLSFLFDKHPYTYGDVPREQDGLYVQCDERMLRSI